MTINKTFLIVVLLLFFKASLLSSQTQKKDSLVGLLQDFQKKPGFEKDTLYLELLYDYANEFGNYNLDSLLLIANKSIRLSKAVTYGNGEAHGYILLGKYNSEIGKQDIAIENFSKALSKAEELQNIPMLLIAKSSLATEFIYKEEYTKALEAYLNGIKIAQKHNVESSLSVMYVNITVVYSILGDYEQCIYYLTKAMELNNKNGNDRLTGITKANLASTYIDINNFKSALEQVDESITLLEKLELREWLCFAYELKAAIFLKQKKFEEALLWFDKSHEFHKSIDQIRYKIPLYNGMSKAYFELKEYEKAETYALKALEFSEEINIVDERDEVLETLYKIKKVTNDQTAALFYFEKFKAISDTINKTNNKKELKILATTQKFNQEKERYLIENEKKVLQQKIYLYFSIFIVLTFAIIIFILRRNGKVQNELNGKLTTNAIELKRKEKFLKNANNNKSKLFSIIAHDLKGPIGSFKSLLDLASSGEITTSQLQDFVPKMKDDVNIIFFTLNNLLSWSQTQMNGSITKPEINNIRPLIEESIALLFEKADAKKIKIINDINFDVITWSDRNQIAIVIRNLISNALKFTPENGEIHITAVQNKKKWQFSFKDNGVGMNAETLQLVFNTSDPFTTYGTQNEKGTGLGLGLCQEMVEKNGGTIWAESTLETGSCFYFTIPKKSS